MKFLRNNLANLFTLGNLFSGSIGTIELIHGNYKITAICILISSILDFFDGFIARALKSNSNLGVELDSLADMVTFGLIPGLTMHALLTPFTSQFGDFFPYLGLLITLFSCLRLAIFNIDEEQKYYFKGLNTPSNTFLIFGLFYAFKERNDFALITQNPIILILLTIISSYLLISPIKMIAMKFKSKKISDNYPKLFLLVGSLILLFIFKTAGIPLLVIYYILISLIFKNQLK